MASFFAVRAAFFNSSAAVSAFLLGVIDPISW
jgi:hypothetical protein